MTFQPGTNRQVPDHSIMDHFGKQTYLGNAYAYAEATSLTGTSENKIFLLSNPSVSASAFPSGWKGLFVNLKRFICTDAAQSVIIRCYVNSVVTGGGSTKVPLNARPACPNTSIAALGTAPTTSSNGSLISISSTSGFSVDEDKSLIILDPGKTLLITMQATGDCSVMSNLGWYEI